jgi:glutathione S-transferase
MKLYFSPASPYARKVRVSAFELGLAARIELLPVTLSPISPNAQLREHNPLGKIPVLLTESGEALYDSPVICEYLDALAGGGRLWPPAGPARWRALRRQALADGITDAAVLVRYEQTVRPEALRWSEWIEGQRLKIRTALAELESDSLEGPFDIGAISIACALGYLDLRFAEERWREHQPRLAGWLATLAQRPSLASTTPA